MSDTRAEVLAELRTQTSLLRLILVALKPESAAAPEHIISGPHGDPLVKTKDPRDWSGESMKGRQFSECPPEYLDLLAERFDYFASKEEDATKQKYNLLDARRARAWAARIRGGWTAPALPPQRVNESASEPTW
jgi:hypothetical protein